MTDTLPHIRIRRATSADAGALAALSRETFLDTFVRGFAIPYSAADLDTFIAKAHSPDAYAAMLADPTMALWLAESPDGAPVGYAVAGPFSLPVAGAAEDDGELRRLYVTPAAKGTGLADRLTREVLAWLGAETRPVWLGVWSLNERAQRFYARYSFEKVAEFDYLVGETVDREFAMRREASPL
jgi:diamine N-acetyltransferase